MSLEEMVGKEFLQEISAKDADTILEALKQYGDDELIDKWISVKIIATEARKGIVKRKEKYQTRLNNLRVRKVTANNFFTLSDLVEDYDKLAEELVKEKEIEDQIIRIYEVFN